MIKPDGVQRGLVGEIIKRCAEPLPASLGLATTASAAQLDIGSQLRGIGTIKAAAAPGGPSLSWSAPPRLLRVAQFM